MAAPHTLTHDDLLPAHDREPVALQPPIPRAPRASKLAGRVVGRMGARHNQTNTTPITTSVGFNLRVASARAARASGSIASDGRHARAPALEADGHRKAFLGKQSVARTV